MHDTMTKEQFIEKCTLCGYCTKKTAETYAADKDKLTDADFEEAYRFEQDRKSQAEAQRRYQHCENGKTTKKYYHGLADKQGAGIMERED